ncbi:MAG TPA: two-component regulator propeller domain-containing protein, partial [Caldimonas sp.]
ACSGLALGVLLACCRCALASDVGPDVSQYRHTSWKVRDGFVQTAIFAIAQTPDGYLWLGTATGLVRFDGVRAVPWSPPAGQELPSGDIRKLLVDRSGRLWIGTLQGLASWKDGKLTRHPQFEGFFVPTLLEDRQGTVWAGGGSVYADGSRSRRANLPAGPRGRGSGKLCAMGDGEVRCLGADSVGRHVYVVHEDARGRLWVAGPDGIRRIAPGAPKLYPLESENCGFFEGENGQLRVLGSAVGVSRLDEDADALRPVVETQIRCGSPLFQSRDSAVWIATLDRGLVHLHHGIADTFRQSDGLSGDWVRAVFEDREGNVWVATTDGLDRFTDIGIEAISQKQGLSVAAAASVLASSDGSVWVGTHDGLNRWQHGRWTIYRPPSTGAAHRDDAPAAEADPLLGGARAARQVADAALPDAYITSLAEDERHRVWVASGDDLAYFADERFTAVELPRTDPFDRFVNAVASDASGNLWISRASALLRMRDGAFDQVPWSALGHKAYALSMLADPVRGGLWMGFRDGGVAYYQDGRVAAQFTTADGLGRGLVNALRLDSAGALWASTQGGLSRIAHGRVATLNRKTGLPCDIVHWSIEALDGSLWLYSACGLVRLERSELEAWTIDPARVVRLRQFGVYEGLRSEPYSSGATPVVGRAVDGKVWFRRIEGVSVVDPLHLPINKVPPPVHVEQLVADRHAYDASSHVELPPLVRDLDIRYTALSLAVPEKVQFKVKLEGRDRDWQDAGTRRDAVYTDLAPGNYRFRVIAANDSGVWNEEGASVDF